MSDYQTRVLTVAAVQLRQDNWESEMVPFLDGENYKEDRESGLSLYLEVGQDILFIPEGSWIIRSGGVLKWMAPEDFDATYEAVP